MPSTKESAFCTITINLDGPLSHIRTWAFGENMHNIDCFRESLSPLALGVLLPLHAGPDFLGSPVAFELRLSYGQWSSRSRPSGC